MLAAASLLAVALSACSGQPSADSEAKAEEATEQQSAAKNEETAMMNNIELSATKGVVRDRVEFKVDELKPDSDVRLIWPKVTGRHVTEDNYVYVGPEFEEEDMTLLEGKSDADGKWSGSFEVPEGFGGDYTVYVADKDGKIGQTAFTVHPTFTMEPESGPAGTEITIKMEGLGWSTYARNWQLTYDNAYTGFVSAIATEGTAEAKIRASGPVGQHAIRLRTGYLGSPYINWKQSPYTDKPEPDFLFEVTDGETNVENRVEDIPEIAGGVNMPELKQAKGVDVMLDKEAGTVGESVTLSASGLEADSEVELVWNTMKGNRVSGLGFAEEETVLDKVQADADGSLTYDFEVPDDLGGIPHRIDLKSGDEVVGQAYLRILPSIVSMEPKSGPVGTKIEVTINGGGWTEFDNAYYLTYDNAFSGYMCSFNSQGNLTFDLIATGEPGHHMIDLYPGIYQQKDKDTDMTIVPQLTYSTDHPGSAMPAIRMAFEVTGE